MRYVDLGAVNALNEKRKQEESVKKRKWWKLLFIFVPILLVFLGLFNAIRREGFSALLNPVSIVTSFVSVSGLEESDGRTNVLVMGLDRRSYQKTGGLTDTLLVGSVSKGDKNVSMISLPRDLWVKLPAGGYSKINAVYALEGRESLEKTIEEVLGIPIHYYVVVDFAVFEKVISILGGVEVNVENAFEDFEYPVEGKENAIPESERYQHVKFVAGLQKMDAKTALIYSRSRHGNNGEGTDFARAKRQQKIIRAIWDKVLSLETLSNPVKLKELYDTYKDTVDTNIGLGEAQKFFEIGKMAGFSNFKSFILDDRSTEENGGLLYAPEDRTLYGGAYVLIPKSGDYSQIHGYIQKLLFSK